MSQNKVNVPLVANMTSMSSSAMSVGQLVSTTVKGQHTSNLFSSSDHTSVVNKTVISLYRNLAADSHINSQSLKFRSDRIQILPFLHIRLNSHNLSILVPELLVCSLAFSLDFG
jgi:hypothetical protein